MLCSVSFQNQVLAEDKGLAFKMSMDDQLPGIIVGDRGRIKQIIINLVSNAIKFTDQGEVALDVVQQGYKNWCISVRDTGVGIPAHLQETIFDEFRQIDDSMERGGTGLGLAITRKLVEMMGGEICVSSEINSGSTFTITLPLITDVAVANNHKLEA